MSSEGMDSTSYSGNPSGVSDSQYNMEVNSSTDHGSDAHFFSHHGQSNDQQQRSQQAAEQMNHHQENEENNEKSYNADSSTEEPTPKPRFKVFIGGLNRITTSETLRSKFEKYGGIIDCDVLFDKFSGRSRGFGFITFDNREVVDVVTKETIEVDGTTVEVREAIPRGQTRQQPQEEKEQSGRLFVGGLSDDVNDEKLRDYFKQFGELMSATVIMDRNTNRSRGFSFVIFKNFDDSERALGKHSELGEMCEAKRAQPRGFVDRGRGGYPMGSYGRGYGYVGARGYGDNYGSPGGYGGYPGYNQFNNNYYAAYYPQMSGYGGYNGSGYAGGPGYGAPGYGGYNGGGSSYGGYGNYDGGMGGSPGPSGADRSGRMSNRSAPY